MNPSGESEFSDISFDRLLAAERKGLRLAIGCRTLAAGVAFLWYVGAPVFLSGVQPRFAAIIVLMVFTAIGIAHLRVIGTRYDRWWIKYAVYTLDVWAICLTFAIIPLSRADDIPQIIAFRAYGIYYLFPFLAMATLSLSWRLVLWTGLMCALAWWAAFVLIIAGMEQTLSWADIPALATREDYETIFLSIDFIGRGNRIEETAMVLIAALALATAVYRARSVFFAQVSAELEWRQERSARERVSGLLGRFVPQEVANRLILDETPMAPQKSQGTALVMDIAGFTDFSAQRSPVEVIAVLNGFLAAATQVISENNGVVITYLGDGFLATFNAPVKIENHARAAQIAALGLHSIAKEHGFDVRVGIAGGELVTGTIGSEDRQSFTVYGNAVNLASRLEGLCKDLHSDTLMDAVSARASGLETKAKGRHIVKGFHDGVDVFAPAQSLQM